jgi:hypothetical protein
LRRQLPLPGLVSTCSYPSLLCILCRLEG